MDVEPQKARFRSEVSPEGYRTVIPARRNGLIVILLCAWLAGWTLGEFSVASQLFTDAHPAPTAFLSLWLIFWTIGGAVVAATILWQLFGREVLLLGATRLSYRTEVLGLGRTRSFRIAEVKDLRSTGHIFPTFRYQRGWLPPLTGSGMGPIAFDYGARTFRLGSALDEVEAKMLVKELAARLPGGSP